MRVAAALAVTILAGSSAHADPPPPIDPQIQAWDLLKHAEDRFRAGDDLGVRELLLPSRVNTERVPSMDRLFGLSSARLNKCVDALAALDRFLVSGAADAAAMAEAKEARDRCKTSLGTRPVLHIETTPPGAEVRLDSEKAPPIGVTPLDAETVPAGDHLLRLQLPGHEPVARLVSLVSGKTTSLKVALWQTPDFTARPSTRPPVTQRRWFWPVIGGAIAVVGIGVGVGVGAGLGLRSSPTVLVFK